MKGAAVAVSVCGVMALGYVGLFHKIYQAKYGGNHEIRAFYYGEGKNRILVWKKGMDLPAASAKVEAWFQ